MDPRLFEAARTGDLNQLFSLIGANPLILQTSALEGGDTPLHVSVATNHLDFTREILNLRPSYAAEVNPDGFTALHIASAIGGVEIVRELLKLGAHLCLVKGRERRIPLHYAVIKGRVQVMKELLEVCPDSVEEFTARRETVIHLAVKNNHFEAFVELVKWLRQNNRDSIINLKNIQGNTVLHLAVAAKQIEVVEFILGGKSVSKDMVEVNALNDRGLTALDVLSMFDSEAGDREIADILIQVGALSAKALLPQIHENGTDDSTNYDMPRCRGPDWWRRICKFTNHQGQWLDYFKYKKDRDNPDFVRSTLLLVAALIATATYQAVLQPPGGLWQDTCPPLGSPNNATSGGKPHKAGQVIMGSTNPISYALFLSFNSLGFFASTQMIGYLTTGFPLQMELRMALFALVATYDASMVALTPNTFFNYFFVGLSIVLPIMMCLLSVWVRK